MSGLAKHARSAAFWAAGTNVLRDVVQFGTMLILVRLLSPQDYGSFTLVNSFIVLATWVSFSNFLAYAIQVKAEDDPQFQMHFTAGGVMQGLAFTVINGIAVCLHWLPKYASVAVPLHVMSVTLLLGWPSEFRRVMLARDFQWRRVAALNVAGLILSAPAGLALAYAGAGVYALLLPGLMAHLPYIYDLFFRAKWRPSWEWSWVGYRSSIAFGTTRIGSGVLVGGRLLLEAAAITATLGLSDLGMLSRSAGLAQMFCAKVSTELMAAIYPILVRAANSEDVGARVGGLLFRIVFWTGIPIAAVLSALNVEVVQILYGPSWSGVAELLTRSLPLSVCIAFVATASSLLLSRGKPKLCLAVDLVLFVGTAVALTTAMPAGTKNYLGAVLIVYALAIILIIRWLVNLGVTTASQLARSFLSASVSASLALAVAFFAKMHIVVFVTTTIFSTIVVCAGFAVVFFVIYSLALRALFPKQLRELISLLPRGDRVAKVLRLSIN